MLHDTLLMLIDNTKIYQDFYRKELVAKAKKIREEQLQQSEDGIELALEYVLADILKERIVLMCDDIVLYEDNEFTRIVNGKHKRRNGETMHDEREIFIQTLVQHALDQINFNELARELLKEHS